MFDEEDRIGSGKVKVMPNSNCPLCHLPGSDRGVHTCKDDNYRDSNGGLMLSSPMGPSGGLTHEQISVACRNVGINLQCGACAEMFYTGSTTIEHDHSTLTYTDGLVRAAEWHEVWSKGVTPCDGTQTTMEKQHRGHADFFRREARGGDLSQKIEPGEFTVKSIGAKND